MGFDEIAGNSRVKSILRRALRRDRVPHALLFAGPPGSGKRRTALALAQALNCVDGTEEPCGVCDSCRAVAGGRHPDVLEIVLEKRKSSEDLKTELSIDQFRDFKRLAYLKPMWGRQRVFLWKADLMSDDARHSILKVVEEPPASTTLVLLSENPDLVLPTIKSRCQTLVFGPIAVEEIEEALRRRGLTAERARAIAFLVRGDLDRALEENWDKAEERRTEAWEAFRGLVIGGREAEFLRRYAGLRRKDVKDDLEERLGFFRAFSRDVVLLQEGGEPERLLNPDLEDGLRELAAKLDPGGGLRLAAAVGQALAGLERHLNTGLLASALTARMTG